MKITRLTLTALAAIIIAACSSSKKAATTTTASSTPASTGTTNSSSFSMLMVKPNDGINAPGEAELTAIQLRYKDVTLEKLKEGHFIYTEGACIKCHGTASIYDRDEAQWKTIIDDMAQKAEISDAQKDAFYKYVLAIKATQAK